MLGLKKRPVTVALCLLLLAALVPGCEARGGRGGGGFRGGGFSRGWGGGHGQAPPVQSSGPIAGKVAGSAAAGAVGGSMVGSALSRPGYGQGYGGHRGSYKGGSAYHPQSNYEPEGSGDIKYYYNSIIVVFGSLMSLVMGHWVVVM